MKIGDECEQDPKNYFWHDIYLLQMGKITSIKLLEDTDLLSYRSSSDLSVP